MHRSAKKRRKRRSYYSKSFYPYPKAFYVQFSSTSGYTIAHNNFASVFILMYIRCYDRKGKDGRKEKTGQDYRAIYIHIYIPCKLYPLISTCIQNRSFRVSEINDHRNVLILVRVGSLSTFYSRHVQQIFLWLSKRKVRVCPSVCVLIRSTNYVSRPSLSHLSNMLQYRANWIARKIRIPCHESDRQVYTFIDDLRELYLLWSITRVKSFRKFVEIIIFVFSRMV